MFPTRLEETRLTSSCLSNLDNVRLHGERLKFAAGCPSKLFYPPPPTGSLQMAKSNPERLNLEALPSPSAASSSSLVVPPRASQSAGVGASADGPNLGSADSQSVERATSHRHASTSPRCAFSWVLDYARCLHRDPSSSPHADFFTLIQVPRPSLKHVIGKGGATLSRIEDLAQCIISIQDCGEHMAMVNFCGDSSGLGRFLVSALVHGHYSVLSAMQRNGVSPIELGPLIP